MRKSFVMFSLLAGILVMALWGLPVLAAPVLVSDSELADISGKEVTFDNTNSSVQYGSFLWSDDHSGDQSDHKGANDVSGATSVVQRSVTALDNAIVWGAYSTMHLIAGDVGSGDAFQAVDTSALQRIGGF